MVFDGVIPADVYSGNVELHIYEIALQMDILHAHVLLICLHIVHRCLNGVRMGRALTTSSKLTILCVSAFAESSHRVDNTHGI